MYFRIVPESSISYARVIYGAYLVLSLIGIKNVRREFKKFVIPLILLCSLTYIAQISLGSYVQMIFVSYLLLINIIDNFFDTRIRLFFLTLSAICATLWMLQSNNQNNTSGRVGIYLIFLSVFFINLSKILKIRSKIRSVILISGISLYLIALILMLDLSMRGICGILFIIFVALIKQLTSNADSSTKIYLGIGWVIST